MPFHTVAPGECLSHIARRYGFSDWRTVYDDPSNADFRQLRPNPNLIHPGDRVFIPDRQESEAPAATETMNRFRLRQPPLPLRVRVLGWDSAPLADTGFTITLEGAPPLRGRTDAAGDLEALIPPDARRGRLEIGDLTFELGIGDLNPLTEATPDRGVSGAQGRLLGLGFDPGPIDGIAGPLTRRALEDFQAAFGLPVTGEPDNATRDRLSREFGC